MSASIICILILLSCNLYAPRIEIATPRVEIAENRTSNLNAKTAARIEADQQISRSAAIATHESNLSTTATTTQNNKQLVITDDVSQHSQNSNAPTDTASFAMPSDNSQATMNNDLQAKTDATSSQQYSDLQRAMAGRIARAAKGTPGKATIATEKVTMQCGADGYPTPEALKQLMVEKYFGSSRPDITVKSVSGGTFTEKVFALSVAGKPVFFLKLSKGKKDVAARLNALQEGAIGRVGIESRYSDTKLPVPKKNLPIIAWVENFFQYDTPEKETATLEVIHAAKGKPVGSFILGSKQSTPADQQTCMQALGKTLGSFQQVFMDYKNPDDPATWTTVSHGDLHSSNVFFDATKSQIYFIDNETMNSNRSITDDINKFWANTSFLNLSFTDKSTSNAQRFSDNITAYFDTYINSFPENKRVVLAKYLQTYVNGNLKTKMSVDNKLGSSQKLVINNLNTYFKNLISPAFSARFTKNLNAKLNPQAPLTPKISSTVPTNDISTSTTVYNSLNNGLRTIYHAPGAAIKAINSNYHGNFITGDTGSLYAAGKAALKYTVFTSSADISNNSPTNNPKTLIKQSHAPAQAATAQTITTEVSMLVPPFVQAPAAQLLQQESASVPSLIFSNQSALIPSQEIKNESTAAQDAPTTSLDQKEFSEQSITSTPSSTVQAAATQILQQQESFATPSSIPQNQLALIPGQAVRDLPVEQDLSVRALNQRQVKEQNSIEERVAASSQAPAEQSLPQQEIMSINTAMPQGTPSTKTYKRGADQVLVDTYGNGTIIAIYPQNRTTFLDGKAKPVGLVKRMVNPDKSIANFYVDGTIKTTPAPSN